MASNKPRAFNPPTVPEPHETYSQVCITPIVPSSKLITLAGQTGVQKDHTISADIREQARGAYDSIHKCLAAAGATPRDIVCFPSPSILLALHQHSHICLLTTLAL
jgi:enamine deaminase RidA (YjgF/YER057c/UK114 family)